MKKTFAMLLLMCGLFAFTACSSDDSAENPVTNVVVANSAKVGSEVIINGSGFTTQGVSLYLKSASGEETNTAATFTSTGAKFNVPYTLAEGTYSVVVKQNSDEWTLGTISLTAPDSPVSAVSLPDNMFIGQEVTIGGAGFAEGDKIVLAMVDKTKSTASVAYDATLDITVTADGAKVTLPATLEETTYAIGLSRGSYVWTLGLADLTKERQIESITISDMMFNYIIGTGDATLNFTYNADGSLASVSSETGLTWNFTYDGNKVTTTSPFTDAPIEFTLDDQKRVATSTAPDAYDETEKYNNWAYSADNFLSSITNQGKSYMGANVTAVIENSLTTSLDWGGVMKFNYGSDAIKSIPNNIDVMALVNFASKLMAKEDGIVGVILNAGHVNYSSKIPTSISMEGMDETGATTWTDLAVTAKMESNVMTIDVPANAASGFYGNTFVVTYKVK